MELTNNFMIFHAGLMATSLWCCFGARNVVQVLDFFIPGEFGTIPQKGKGIRGGSKCSSAGDMTSFTEIYMIMELCDSDLKKLCRQGVWMVDGWLECVWRICIALGTVIFMAGGSYTHGILYGATVAEIRCRE